MDQSKCASLPHNYSTIGMKGFKKTLNASKPSEHPPLKVLAIYFIDYGFKCDTNIHEVLYGIKYGLCKTHLILRVTSKRRDANDTCASDRQSVSLRKPML